MVKLRLTRVGRHKRAFYRLVAIDSRTKTAGGYIELLGHFDPVSEEIKLSDEAILNWLALGAQPSDTVKNILKQQGIWAKFVNSKANKTKNNADKPAKPKKVVVKPKTATKKAATKK